jgi:polyhydroxyalkanoate synthase
MSETKNGPAPAEATPSLPDPQEMAKIFAEVAERAAKVLTEYTTQQLKKGLTPQRRAGHCSNLPADDG